ncbi:MAG: STAS domain-containing protein [Phycisphaerae bacterium]|nr:STAS domain-containing protein [Phycisphaerae bacterium]
MFLDMSEHAGVKVLYVGGELGGPDDAKLIEIVNEQLEDPGDSIIIDLGKISFINSTGLNTLVRLSAQANVQEQRVVYANLTPMIEGLFSTTQLDRFFEVHGDVQAAASALKRES